MARTKNQSARREQLVAATLRVVAERGLGGVRIRDVAEAAGISPRLVAYYYPDLDDLLDEVYRGAVERYYWQRLKAMEELNDPVDRLTTLIGTALPGGRDDLLSRVLYEMSVNGSRNPLHATLLTLMFDREVSLYATVLEAGCATGTFTLSEPITSVARNFVALEDAYGLHLLGNNSSLDAVTAEELLRSYARIVTGAPIPSGAGP